MSSTQQKNAASSLKGRAFKVLPVLLLIAGVGAAWLLMKNSPRVDKVKIEPKARLVNVETAAFSSYQPVIEVSGEVKAARSLTLYPRVGGRVQSLESDLLPGELVAQGDILLKLDPADYQLTVREKQSALAKAEAQLLQEKGQQAIARREYELMGQKLSADDEAFVLRKPELAIARSAVDSATVQLQQAQLNLERTQVKVPFNSRILSRNIEPGSEVSTGTALLELVSTDEFWLEVSVPVSQLDWIVFPEDEAQGSQVKITSNTAWNINSSRSGEVLSLLPRLEESTRMARVIISIDDPMALKPENNGLPKVLVGDFLQAGISGHELDNVILVSREWLHGDNKIWLMNDMDQLEIRQVEVLFRGRDQVVLKGGVQAGERIITTLLPVVVEGMPLKVMPTELASEELPDQEVASL